MKAFRFSLQPVRVLREQREQDAQRYFADSMRACEEAAFQLQAASEELASAWTALCEELSAGTTATKLLRTRSWCSVLELRQKERTAALQRAQRVMDHAWREMLTATRDRKALDTYYDKCRNAHERETLREEQKMMDEIGIRRTTASGILNSPRRRGTEPL